MTNDLFDRIKSDKGPLGNWADIAEGYYVLKLIKTNKNGIPDILAIPPNSNVIFSEVKTLKGRVSELQKYRLKELETYGFSTEIYRG